MDTGLRAYLTDFYAEHHAHDAEQPDRLLRWRNLEPESAELLSVLVRATRPRRLLELGTSNGYSTCWLADAAAGAAFASLDIDPDRTAAAAKTLEGAGLRDRVDLVTGDAADYLRRAASDSVDLLFLDAERPHYVSYWPDIQRVLVPGGLLVTDNVVSHADQVSDFIAEVRESGWATTIVEVGAGLLLAVAPTS